MHIRFGEFELDSRRFLLVRGDEKVSLRPKVFDLLIHLARHRERVVTREELVAELWGETQVGTGSLSGLVNELRQALSERGRGPSSIRTVHARGYQFVAEVEPAPELAPRSFVHGAAGVERIEAPSGRGVRQGAGESEARVSGAESQSVGVGTADVLDRIRFDLGRVLRDGARGLIVAGGSAAERSGLLARAVSLACHLGFDGIRLDQSRSASREHASLGYRLLEILVERHGLPALRATASGEIDELLSDGGESAGGAAGEAERVWTTRLVRVLRRLALERPMLLAVDSNAGLDPGGLALVSSILRGSCADAPILWLASSDSPVAEDSLVDGESAVDGTPPRHALQPSRLAALIQGGGVEMLRLVESERALLDRWLVRRGLEPLPELLADAIVCHLSGRGGAVEEVLDRLEREASLAGLVVPEGSGESNTGKGALPRRLMRSVRPTSANRQGAGEGAA
jgi:DNA-binding winged helix-turn-helix (wHTH) protein